MSETVIFTIISLSAIGIVAAMILFFIAQKFKVFEDPKIDEVEEVLPSANCGGCGFPGCRNFAEACVKAENLGDLFCPVGGNECMSDVAKALGKEVVEKDPVIAVLKCNGACDNRAKTNQYDGAYNCTAAHNLYGGDTGCHFGCLGMGECVDACNFDAMYMDEKTGLPVIDDEKCTACNACVEACPKLLLELRPKGKKSRRIFVSCMNKDKGAAKKIGCDVACIGCKRCVKECKFDAITVDNFLAYIDADKCTLCRKCVVVCPTKAIHELNFPPRKVKVAKPEKAVVEKAKVADSEKKEVITIENKDSESKSEKSDS
ncbi:MAG: Fe-S cluster domain-containing protein [Bacteroidetes bacterium]|jgi:Na+-translocating ferredoxin:NAD+ oxidoreductase subunit B|nr:Fe-S cluster domain-containing protein [Bacteroidota bacterium]MBT6687692.1 Fe-S cluster domain-containing protein [Bacteroidota bacterium]MBT7143615.1 Fe-S cluster domain-containing protein [Bacteroidota bacterium]MBT7490516.1 Fe-S cluster domain-containing protein [Bacteroidota bacterium]